LPDDPSFPFSIGVEPLVAPGAFVLGLVRRGALRVVCPGPALTLPPGTLFLIPPGSGCRLSKDAGTAVAGFSFGRSLVDPLSLDSSLDLVVEMLASPLPRVACLRAPELAEAAAIFSSLEREATDLRLGFPSMVRLKLTEAILILGRAGTTPGGTAVQDRKGPAVLRFHPEEAMQYIRDRCADQLTLAGVAARYGLNPSYFSRIFHGHAGIPLVEFINRARIQRSCLLLKRSDASIVEIAVAVGYNNLSHFNRQFRRIMAASPREYRLSSRK
jgi:AraC-like DNA-binding protein